jgi:hypothetical protein
MRSGGFPWYDAISAPIAESGVMTRAMGRRESDSSPTISLVNFCPATMPHNIRIVEPELPQSRALVEGASERPRPCTSMVLAAPSWSLRSHVTPRERMQARVLAQSAPVE